MALRCRYCGGQHDTPAQLRECWQQHNRSTAPSGPAPAQAPAPVSTTPKPKRVAPIPAAPARGAAARGAAPSEVRSERVQGDDAFPMYRDEDFSPPDDEFDHGFDFDDFDRSPSTDATSGQARMRGSRGAAS